MKHRVGFIGLGLMGNPMAKNILKKGFPLTIYNRTKEKTKELLSLGATSADSPGDLASQVDLLITMVTAGNDVEEILFGNQGAVYGAKKGFVVVDTSTIGPTAAKSIAKKLSSKHIDFLDAPVTGSTPKAISGELTIFVGGKKSVLEKTYTVLHAMGTNIVYLGSTGSGQAVKLINNYLLASYIEALSECMLLSDAMKLPRKKVVEALSQTPNLSPIMKLKFSNYIKDDFPLLFSLANMRKDLGLARSEMEQTKKYLPGLMQIESIYGKANEDTKLTSKDFSIIIKELEKEFTKN